MNLGPQVFHQSPALGNVERGSRDGSVKTDQREDTVYEVMARPAAKQLTLV